MYSQWCFRISVFAGITMSVALAPAVHAQVAAPGAVIRMASQSTVGVLLDEIPAGPLREAAAANALAQPGAFWTERAARQVRLMSYRLIWRAGKGNRSKTIGPLPLPPREVWNVSLLGAPRRAPVDGHDMVVVDYRFASAIVSDAVSPGLVDPKLGQMNGNATLKINLPVDPELLVERTGYSCMDEFEFPPNSVFEENPWYYYDDTCTPGSTACHVTMRPSTSCVEALVGGPGRVLTTLLFTRVPYDAAEAARYRVGHVNPRAVEAGAAADLAVVPEGLRDERAFIWRFFGPGSCELEEGVIGQYGWRRLLTFSAIVRNDGTDAVHLGDVSDPANPYVASNAFEYSACHHHYHFSHYGVFNYAGGAGSKRAFCLEDTNRYRNDETTPLTAVHQSCSQQGIGAGWGDEYNFGIPGQWVDVTGRDTTTPQPLSFLSNPDGFLCEGTIVRDASGRPLFEPTSFLNKQGQVESRVRCNFLDGWDASNFGSVPVASPGGSFVTEACTRGQIGPQRNCGFVPPVADVQPCASGAPVRLSCQAPAGATAVLRVCEVSGQWKTGVACTRADAVANVVVGATLTPVAFICPAVRDAVMSGGAVPVPQTVPGIGGYSVYRAALGNLGSSDDTAPTVTCSPG